VTGWAVANLDYDRAGVRIFVGDRLVHHGVADLPRPDVQLAYPTFGPNTGIDVTVNAPPGKHLVCLWAVDRRNGRQSLLGMREVEIGGPIGTVEQIAAEPGRIVAQGWALSGPRKLGAAAIRIFLDTGFVAELPSTDVSRPDVVSGYPGAFAASGYSVPVAASPGKHLICVWAVDPTTRADRLLDAREVVVP
jgi:hypothetical protein